MARGRPVEKRTKASYAREVEGLNRLRMSLQLYETPSDHRDAAVRDIDSLILHLLSLRVDVAKTEQTSQPQQQQQQPHAAAAQPEENPSHGSGEHAIDKVAS